MARLRYNGLTAELGAALLTADTAVTFASALTSAEGAVPTLGTGEYVPFAALDANGAVVEVFHLTAYTSGATTGTVARAREGTTAADHSLGANLVHGPTIRDHQTKAANAQTGTAYTLRLSDAGNAVDLNNAAAITLTVPPNSSVPFPVGTVIEGAQLGAGQVTITPGAGVTVNASPGMKTAEQYATYGLRKVATDTWLAYGRLSA